MPCKRGHVIHTKLDALVDRIWKAPTGTVHKKREGYNSRDDASDKGNNTSRYDVFVFHKNKKDVLL